MRTNYIKVYTGSFVVVELLKSRLEDHGITPIVKDESESARLAGFGASIQFQQEVYVHESELGTVVPIVESTLAEMKV